MDNLLIVSLGIFLGYFVQTIAGFGATLTALPILLIVLSIQESVSLLSIFFFIFAIILIYKNWRAVDKKALIQMALGIIPGVFLGVYFLKFGKPLILKRGLGLFVLCFVVYKQIKQKRIKAFQKLGFIFGLIGGFFGGLFSAGGPPYVIYVSNKLKEAKKIRATIIGAIATTSFLRLPILISSKVLTIKAFIRFLYVFPFFFLALYLGQKLSKKINEKTFRKILFILLALSGFSLLLR